MAKTTPHSGTSNFEMVNPYPEGHDGETDFTIARSLSAHLVNALCEYFDERDPDIVEISRQMINSTLNEEVKLSKGDAESLFTGLIVNGAAEQASSASSFSEYTFEVDTERALCILKVQNIAREALEKSETHDEESDSLSVQLVGTFPPEIDENRPPGILSLSEGLRRMVFDADSIVRIANPYFDPSPSVVGDIAALANRGVRTKILTRETESADKKLRSTLNSMYEDLDPSKRDLLEIRDLYRRDTTTGNQEYATHAKIAIADEGVCYLGSANLTNTSLDTNFELGVVMQGDIVGTATETFDTVFEYARSVDLPI